MHYCDSIFGALLKALPRRTFGRIVERHDGDRYVKNFESWDHFVIMLYGQLTGLSTLRSLTTSWNAHSHHHYHLGSEAACRSTLSDANARRPVAIFAEVFDYLSGKAAGLLGREGREVVRLIDSTPIPLDQLHDWTEWNGRTRGLKLHVMYDPHADHPLRLQVTPANVNDVNVGRAFAIEPGASYAFDKGYCDYRWWNKLDAAGARFVTRPKSNVPFWCCRRLPLPAASGDGFTVTRDEIVQLASQGRSRLAFPLRRITVKADAGHRLTLISNDLDADANELAALYKARWQIELLFRWIKQHLKIRKFLGRSENAVRLQLFAALIAFLLLRMAERDSKAAMPPIRFAELVRTCIFTRKPISRIDRPPDPKPTLRRPDPNQLVFAYA